MHADLLPLMAFSVLYALVLQVAVLVATYKRTLAAVEAWATRCAAQHANTEEPPDGR